MERIRRGWFEREEIQKVTLDMLKTNCKLTEREIELLQIVSDRKLVRRDFLEIISESYRKLGTNRTALLNRAIRKLYRNMYLDKIHETQEIGRGNTPCIVSLDKGGSLYLNIPHKKRITHTKSVIKGKEYIYRSLPTNFRHINGVNKMEVDTILFCEGSNSKIILWSHEHKNLKTFTYGQEKIVLIPDAFMILEVKNKHIVAFLEYDTGSESLRYKEPPVIRDKIIKYKKYRSSQLWLEEDWQKLLPQPEFPLVLFVTEDEKRIEFFNHKSKELGVRGFGVYHKNYSKVLEKMATLIK